jgi:hypothetical protein
MSDLTPRERVEQRAYNKVRRAVSQSVFLYFMTMKTLPISACLY